MSALTASTKKEENDKPASETSGIVTSKPAFSPERSVIEASMQCPHENMTPNGDQADLLKPVDLIDSISSDGPAKTAHVNGSVSPSISQETLLDISKSIHTQNSANTPTTIQVEDCDLLRKDGEMAIRQMVTAEDVENRGIWGFDADSPENSLDSYDDRDDLEWNPKKEFMKFLMEDQDCSETESKISAAPSRRKCKLGTVVMVNHTENSKHDLHGGGSHKEANPETKRSRMHSSLSNKSKYSNGTAVAFKHLLQKPAKTVKNSPKPGCVKENLSRDSGSEEEPPLFPSNSGFTEKSHSQTKNCSNQKPFICKECGTDFYTHTSLLKHITVHQENRHQFVKGITGTDGITNEGKDARLQCPQCNFGTNCPNTFVQHAKTHEKDKRYYPCQKCTFMAASKNELIDHMLRKHPVSDARCTIIGRKEVLQRQKVAKAVRKPNLVRKRKSFEKYSLFLHDSENSSHSSSAERKLQPSVDAEDAAGLLQKDKPKSKNTAKDKLDKGESKLDKSIHTLLSRKRNRHSESKPTPGFDEIGVRTRGPDLDQCCKDDSGSPSPAKSKGDPCALKDDDSVCTLKPDGSHQGLRCNNDYSKGHHSSTNHKHVPSPKLSLKKSPSKRKMSTPFHNLQGQDILIDFPKCRQIFQKNSSLYLVKKCDAKDDVHSSSSAFRSPHASYDLSTREPGLLPTVSIKEECVETEVCGDNNELDPIQKNEDFKIDLKSCPYCPARFQSGISLSNHIRGHLHRVGVSYEARHVVSIAQVASQDKVPHVRRRMAAIRKIKKELELPLIEPPPERKSELTCPLCREWFDNKKGLSNHARGHLKRLGKTCSTATVKSPVIILKELMRDKKQFQIRLQALEKKLSSRSRNSFYRCKFSNGLMVPTAKVQRFTQGGKRHGYVSSRSAEDKKRTDGNKDPTKGSPSSDLIGILKKRRAHEEAKVKALPQTARKSLLVNAVKERDPSAQLSDPVSEKSELNRKVCVHCNATFHSGVSLSNHLRAYARRKRNALLEGTTYDCKRKQRSRSRKKTYPLLHTPEEIYRLTCRFCDLVFQGPLSVQEDWVKHLQRHIMNTAVPHTGAAMVEVTCLPKDTDTNTHPQKSS